MAEIQIKASPEDLGILFRVLLGAARTAFRKRAWQISNLPK